MQDWTPLLNNRTRHGSFVGKTARDEDAYFAAFANDPAPHRTQPPVLTSFLRRVTDLMRSAKLG